MTTSTASRGRWLVKQEPEEYPWDALVADRSTAWTGVRNFQARNNLRAMKSGDLVIYYHSGSAREAVGICRVTKSAYRDPTSPHEDWLCVDLAPVRNLPKPVPLAVIKADPTLSDVALVRQSRLSVMPLTEFHFNRIIELGGLQPQSEKM